MNTGNTQQLDSKTCSSIQTLSSVGFQAVQDDKTTQTKPPGCHQPDIGMSSLTRNQITRNAILGHANMSLNVPISVRTGKQGPVCTGLGTQLGGGGQP